MKRRRSKKSLKKVRSLNHEISHRIMLLSGVIMVAFLIIFIRLFYIQVISYQEYTAKKDDYTSVKQYVSAPRGQIYDRKGRVLAATVVSHNIVYTSPQNMSDDDYLVYARRIVSVFNVKVKDFTTTEKKEAYIAWKSQLDPDDSEYMCNNLLTAKERREYNSGAWGSDAETVRHSILMRRIGKKQLKEMTTKQMKTYLIYNRMTENASTGQENVVLEDVSDDDVAYIVEHKSDFPGFDVDFGGWKREYPYGETLSDVLGTVSTSTEGLPEELADYYLQRGYQYNASVGKSGLELQYNDVLSGTPQESKITYNSQGLAKQTVTREAVKGNDVYLTIDIELQQSVDDTVKETLENYGGTTNRENFSTLFMCMMNPNDGSILAMSGYTMDLDTRELTYYASGCYKSLVNPGSCVKGATVYMAESEGVIEPGEVFVDQPIIVGGTEYSSYTNHGAVNDINALAVSSNVYMFNIAIRMAGQNYSEGMAFNVDDVGAVFTKMRQYFSEFGLGVKTGLDVPDEANSYQASSSESTMLLNFVIGQYDMYTPIQLLTYASTIATTGKQYKPTLMKCIKEVNSDQNIEIGTGQLRNVLPEKNIKYLKRVREGFRQVVAQGNASASLQNMSVEVSGKTGTAEVDEWTTANFVGYAPSDDPTVSFACSAPTSSVNLQSVSSNICTDNVVPDALNEYFELYPVDEN